MKKLLILGMALILLAPTIEARKKQKKAGTITDKVYHDDKYGIDLTLHENWKVKVGKEKDNVRLRLTQRKYEIPSDYIDAPDYTKVPSVTMYIDTTSFGVHVFIDSLISEVYKSNQKKAILKEFDFLNERDVVPKRRSRLEIAGESALIWKGEAKYTKEVSESATSSMGKFVKRSYGGAIVAVKMGENILLFHVMTEWEYFEPVMQEVLPMITSLVILEEDEG